MIADINQQAAENTAKELGARATGVRVDVSDETQVQQSLQAAVSKFGKLDIVISNAGFQHIAPIWDFPLEQWKKMLDVHLTGSFLYTKHALREFQKSQIKGLVPAFPPSFSADSLNFFWLTQAKSS